MTSNVRYLRSSNNKSIRNCEKKRKKLFFVLTKTYCIIHQIKINQIKQKETRISYLIIIF